MQHRARIMFVVMCSTGTLMSCSHNQKPTAMANDQYEMTPKRDTMPAVMQAKLAHTQAVLEGIALANFSQIELNANDLYEISNSADWLAHETASYFAFSDEFRKVTKELAAHAQKKDLKAVTDDYSKLTHTCVACHTYLRQERQTKDMPGRVSWAPGQLQLASGVLSN